MRTRTHAFVRGGVVTLAAITMTLTVSVIPAAAATTVTSFTPPSGPPGTLVTVTGSGFTAGTGVSSVTLHGVATTYNVADDQHLTATVPIGATTGRIVVTASGGIGTSSTDFIVPVNPVINGFSPSSGPPGTAVTITGSGFTGVNSVTFNGTAATFNFLSDAQVATTVPSGATTGKITLTTTSGTTTSASNFTVSSSSAPTISGFSPSSGAIGATVTINGNHFTGVTGVRFNGSSASFVFVNDGRVTATVPNGATTGRITLTTGAGTVTSTSDFTVTGASAPTISGFSPSSAVIGATVTINGSHFTGVTGVRFNGSSASFVFVNDGRVTATVPTGATTGRITLTTPGGTATSSSNFTVTGSSAPTISGFSPSSGVAGTSVTINGNHFTAVSSVRFNGASAVFVFVNDGRVTATVPSSATTGRITVTTPGGTATSSSNFTVQGGGNHERSVFLSISGRYASGRVSVDDGYSACLSNVPVVIKRFHHGDWHWVTTTSTKSDGSYKALIGGKNGGYKAKAKKITLVNGTICQGDQSATVHH